MMSQSKGNQNGCSKPRRNVDEGIGCAIEDLEAYICDEICFCNNMQLSQEERDRYCNNCQIGKKVDEIETEYDRINSFSQSEAWKLLRKYRRIVLCSECEYRACDDRTMYWCRRDCGLGGRLEAFEGCSRGKEKE